MFEKWAREVWNKYKNEIFVRRPSYCDWMSDWIDDSTMPWIDSYDVNAIMTHMKNFGASEYDIDSMKEAWILANQALLVCIRCNVFTKEACRCDKLCSWCDAQPEKKEEYLQLCHLCASEACVECMEEVVDGLCCPECYEYYCQTCESMTDD